MHKGRRSVWLRKGRRSEFVRFLTSVQCFIALLLAALGQQEEDIADLSVSHHLLCHLLAASLKWRDLAPPTVYICHKGEKNKHANCGGKRSCLVFLWPHPHHYYPHPLSSISFSTVVVKKEKKTESSFIPQGTAILQQFSSSFFSSSPFPSL